VLSLAVVITTPSPASAASTASYAIEAGLGRIVRSETVFGSALAGARGRREPCKDTSGVSLPERTWVRLPWKRSARLYRRACPPGKEPGDLSDRVVEYFTRASGVGEIGSSEPAHDLLRPSRHAATILSGP
jgi:hypothetical protein